MTAAVLCNNARIGAAAAGDPTERALLHLAHDLGVDTSALLAESQRAHEIPFDSVRKRMTTLHDGPDGLTAAGE